MGNYYLQPTFSFNYVWLPRTLVKLESVSFKLTVKYPIIYSVNHLIPLPKKNTSGSIYVKDVFYCLEKNYYLDISKVFVV